MRSVFDFERKRVVDSETFLGLLASILMSFCRQNMDTLLHSRDNGSAEIVGTCRQNGLEQGKDGQSGFKIMTKFLDAHEIF